MSVLVKVGYETAERFKGKGVSTKLGNKKHQVYFKLYCDDSNLAECVELAKTSGNIVMLEYQGLPTSFEGVNTGGVYITKVHEYGMNLCEDDIKDAISTTPEGVTTVIKLPLEYNDMRFIYNMSQKYTNVRFCGGTVFCIEGCRLGCCGRDILDKKGIKYNENQYIHEGCSCALETLAEEDVELVEAKLKDRKQRTSSGGTKKKKTVMFKDLLYQGGAVDF